MKILILGLGKISLRSITIVIIFFRNFFSKPSFSILFNYLKASKLIFNLLLLEIISLYFFSSFKYKVFY